MADDQKPEGLRAIPFGGMIESSVPEANPADAFYSQGLVPNAIGELKKFPGKTKLLRQGERPILGIYQFGDTVLIENTQQLVRYTNAEIFGGTETSPNQLPDRYLETLTEEEENMSIAILKYNLATNNAGAALTNNAWNMVPFATEECDTGALVTFTAGGAFNIANATAVTMNIRVEADVCFYAGSTAAGYRAAKLRLETAVGALGAGVLKVTGLNAAINSSSTSLSTVGTARLVGRFSLAAATTTEYRLLLYLVASAAGARWGPVVLDGQDEVYAQIKLLFEPTVVPIADGVHAAATYGVSITTEDGLITATA